MVSRVKAQLIFYFAIKCKFEMQKLHKLKERMVDIIWNQNGAWDTLHVPHIYKNTPKPKTQI
jgi:hypothetical protein